MGFNGSGLSAKTKINRKDWGLNWNQTLETGGWLVSEDVTIEIDLETVQKPAAVQEAGAAAQ